MKPPRPRGSIRAASRLCRLKVREMRAAGHGLTAIAKALFNKLLRPITGLPPAEMLLANWLGHGQTAFYSVFRSSCIVSCGLEVVGAFGGGEDLDEAPDGGPKALNRALGGFPEQSFEFGEGVLDRVEVGAVGRQVEQSCAGRLDCVVHLAACERTGCP